MQALCSLLATVHSLRTNIALELILHVSVLMFKALAKKVVEICYGQSQPYN